MISSAALLERNTRRDTVVAELLNNLHPTADRALALRVPATLQSRSYPTPATFARAAVALRPMRTGPVRSVVLPEPPKITLQHETGGILNLKAGRTEVDGSVAVSLPFGAQNRMITARAFKRRAGYPHDTLFRQAGDRWDVVHDLEMVDLSDRKTIFKLGTQTLFS